MGSIIMDLLKDIPLSAVLKEKILGLDAKLLESETEITLLKGDLRKANVQIEQLQDENKRLTYQINSANQQTPILDEVAHKILTICAKQDADGGIYRDDIAREMEADPMTIKYHVERTAKGRANHRGGSKLA